MMEIDVIELGMMVAVFALTTAIYRLTVMCRNLGAFIAHYLRDATRCPECDHPAVGASFCEDTIYICPQCGEKFIWKLQNDRYILATNIEGESHG